MKRPDLFYTLAASGHTIQTKTHSRKSERESKGLMNQHVDKIINKLIKLIYFWLISLRIIGLGKKHGMKSSVMMKMDSSRFDEK